MWCRTRFDPVAPAFGTPLLGLFGVFGAGFVGGHEVLREGRLWLDGDDRTVLLPDVLEERRDQLASLGLVRSVRHVLWLAVRREHKRGVLVSELRGLLRS